jgi:hypothetical protein
MAKVWEQKLGVYMVRFWKLDLDPTIGDSYQLVLVTKRRRFNLSLSHGSSGYYLTIGFQKSHKDRR